MRVLVANAGSSSLKLRLLEADDRLVASKDLPVAGGVADAEAIGEVVRGFGPVDVVGHRIVHGGPDFTSAARIDEEVVGKLEQLTDLAPLHQPLALSVLSAVRTALPDVPSVACFDTAFFAGLPDSVTTYALPREWRERWKLRRYGFHGLSHAYVTRRAVEMMGGGFSFSKIVSCHLGAGASLAAVQGGNPHHTTMGFTPLEGLIMATRSGSVDPGLLLWLQQRLRVSADEMLDALEHRSGLLGLAGTADMREVEARMKRGDPNAKLAFDTYLCRLVEGIAVMTTSLGQLDVLVFTGGVGENAIDLRERAAKALFFLGADIDFERNQAGKGDRFISRDGARVRVLVIESREDLEIARQAREVMTT